MVGTRRCCHKETGRKSDSVYVCWQQWPLEIHCGSNAFCTTMNTAKLQYFNGVQWCLFTKFFISYTEMIESMNCTHSSDRDTYLRPQLIFRSAPQALIPKPFSSWHPSRHWMQNKMTENDHTDSPQIVPEEWVWQKFPVFQLRWNSSQYLLFAVS